MSEPDFWQDNLSANKLVQEQKALRETIEPWQEAEKKFLELKEFSGIADEDSGIIQQIASGLQELKEKVDRLEFRVLLSGQFDRANAILSINAGAGGTESCDWVGMLLRMYQRWAESRKFKVVTTDILAGEEAGIKNVTIQVVGEYAFGYLRSESGVHRLVRISPFDANKRRHT